MNNDAKGLEIIISIIGIVAGILFIKTIGFENIFLPAICITCAYIISNRVIKNNREMLPAFAIQIGHAATFFAAMIILGVLSGYVPYNVLIDVIILTIFSIWLIKDPSLPPIIVLTIYHSITMSLNGYTLIFDTFSGSLLINIIIRVISIVFMYTGFNRITKNRKSQMG